MNEFLPKISYRKHFGSDGTVYRQRITLPYSYFNKLRDIIQSEIALGYPQKNKYVQTSGDEMYLKEIRATQGRGKTDFCYTEINHTQTRFLNLFLKLNLKDFNTYIIFK